MEPSEECQVKDYWKSIIYSVPYIAFDSRGARYTGRGKMEWSHKFGFKIEAELGRTCSLSEKPAWRRVAGLLRLPDDSKVGTIRMRLDRGRRVITHAYLEALDDLV